MPNNLPNDLYKSAILLFIIMYMIVHESSAYLEHNDHDNGDKDNNNDIYFHLPRDSYLQIITTQPK